jgi:formate-dependent nitrite reductase cytochrome c552 subunit
MALFLPKGQVKASSLPEIDATPGSLVTASHAPQELARILGESIDMSRQAQFAAVSLKVTMAQALPAAAK